MSPPPIRPLYLPIDGGERFLALLHMPAPGAQVRQPVLICPPYGWDETCSYRSRREWAEQLAAAGHPALRIDLPGTGDSGGCPGDPDLLGAWAAAARVAAGWLGEMAGAVGVAAIGIGLGGLVVCQALGEGAAIDDLVLWATPARGRTLLRELRAIAHMESAKWVEQGMSAPPQDGRVTVGGFALSAAAAHELEELDISKLEFPPGRPRRVLLLERDGIAVDHRLLDSLSSAGAAITVCAGEGYGKMTVAPHEARPPLEVFVRTLAWLDEAHGQSPGPPAGLPADATPTPERLTPSGHPRTPSPAPAGPSDTLELTVDGVQVGETPAPAGPSETLELTVDGVQVRETPITVEQPSGLLFGVLAEPVSAPGQPLGVLLLNAGAHRRIGQGRMWVGAARRWAAEGVPTLRLDLEGIGDAEGDAWRFKQVGQLYTPELVDQTLAALDALDARGLGPSYVLAGLCSGAFWSFHAALRDDRVRAAFMLNPAMLFWDPSQHTARALRRGSRSKVLRGEVPPGKLAALAVKIPPLVLGRARARLRARRGDGDELGDALDRLRDMGKTVRMMFSGPEPLLEELTREGRAHETGRWPNLGFDLIPGQDHILRALESQRIAQEALDRALDRELARVNAGRSEPLDRRSRAGASARAGAGAKA